MATTGPFTIIFWTPFSFLVGVKGRDVIMVDSTFRKLNNNQAPLTIISTLEPVTNTSYPVMAFFTSDISANTLSHVFTYLKNAIHHFCLRTIDNKLPKHIIEKYPDWESTYNDFFPEWKTHFQEIIEFGFNPKIVCIDMSVSERKGIEIAFPEADIYVCEFHLNQTISRLSLNDYFRNFLSYKYLFGKQKITSTLPLSIHQALITISLSDQELVSLDINVDELGVTYDLDKIDNEQLSNLMLDAFRNEGLKSSIKRDNEKQREKKYPTLSRSMIFNH